MERSSLRRYGAAVSDGLSASVARLVVGTLLVSALSCRQMPAAGPEPAGPPDEPYGVVLNPNRVSPEEGEYARAAQMVKDLGLKWVRVHTEWRQVEPRRGEFHWEKYDTAVDDLHKAGINILYQVSGIPQWASDEARVSFERKPGKMKTVDPEPRIPDFVQFIVTLVKRYKDKVHYWQILNETNARKNEIKPAQFAAIMKAVYAKAKEVDPTCKIVLGGLAGNNKECMHYLRKFLSAGGGDAFDIIDFHCYKFISRISVQLPERRKLLESFGIHKPIWIVETSDPSDFKGDANWAKLSKSPESQGPWDLPEGPQTEETQAQRLVKRLTLARSVGVQRTFWYSFRARGDAPEDESDNIPLKTKGLVREDFSPKRAYFAFKCLVAKLGKVHYTQKLPAEKGVEAHLFSAGNHRVLVAWVWEGTAPLSVKAASTASVTDKMGKKLADLAPKDGLLTITVTEDPVYVEWDE